MGTTLVHTLKEIPRGDAAEKRFGPCILEADIDVQGRRHLRQRPRLFAR